MAWMDLEKKREYERKYHLSRYHKKREEALRFLGGRCVECGTTDGLEIDHIDPETKSFEIAELWSINARDLAKELQKCQALCREHHHLKSLRERGQQPARHGTYYMYRKYKCRCLPCREAEREQRKGWETSRR